MEQTQLYTRDKLAKIDKSKYTKEEIKELRENKRQRKYSKNFAKLSVDNKNEKNVLVLKHGQKYSSDYVNKMYNMVSRNLTYPFKMHCITEDPTGLDPAINVIPLPPSMAVNGWWYKPYIYSNDLPINGTILYLDLDLVIVNKIDRLFDFYPGEYCIIRDFTRAMRPGWEKYNSSVIKFEKGQLDRVWKKFQKQHQSIIRKFFGDQDYLYDETRDQAKVFPDSWVRSWKWEIRKDKAFKPGATKGNREFKTIEHIKAPMECCIVAFHGDPNPHKCKDPYIVDNWR